MIVIVVPVTYSALMDRSGWARTPHDPKPAMRKIETYERYHRYIAAWVGREIDPVPVVSALPGDRQVVRLCDTVGYSEQGQMPCWALRTEAKL